jgi:hypothetical protein
MSDDYDAILTPVDQRWGRVVTIDDWRALGTKAVDQLSDDDLLVVQAFEGLKVRAKLEAARDRARMPQPPPAPVVARKSAAGPPVERVLDGALQRILGLEGLVRLLHARVAKFDGPVTPDVARADRQPPEDAQALLKKSHDRIDELEQRVKTLELKPEIAYCGSFQDSTQYSPGSLVTRSGSLWLATARTAGAPGADPHWKLIVKSGRAT